MSESVEQYLAGLPTGNADRKYYLERIKQLKTDCGCALGAVFLLLAVCAAALYAALVLNWNHSNWPGLIATVITTLFLSTLVGKAIGIAVARFRLRLLYRTISRQANRS